MSTDTGWTRIFAPMVPHARAWSLPVWCMCSRRTRRSLTFGSMCVCCLRFGVVLCLRIVLAEVPTHPELTCRCIVPPCCCFRLSCQTDLHFALQQLTAAQEQPAALLSPYREVHALLTPDVRGRQAKTPALTTTTPGTTSRVTATESAEAVVSLLHAVSDRHVLLSLPCDVCVLGATLCVTCVWMGGGVVLFVFSGGCQVSSGTRLGLPTAICQSNPTPHPATVLAIFETASQGMRNLPRVTHNRGTLHSTTLHCGASRGCLFLLPF